VERPWLVLRVDPDQRRISVTLPADGDVAIPDVAPGATVTGKVQRIERYGVFVWLAPGKVGLVPNALTGTPPGTDLARRFGIADDLEVDVVEVDATGRIRLAVKGAAEAAARRRSERAPRADRPRRRRERTPEAPPMSDSNEGFGSLLADKLKDALG